MDLGDDEVPHNTRDDHLRVCLTRSLGAKHLSKILSYLWFDDHAVIGTVCLVLHDVIQSESLATLMLQRLLEYVNQPLRSSRISFNAEVRQVLLRVSSWPTAVDAAALIHSQGPRNVNIVLSDHLLGNDSRVVYQEKRKENRSKAYAVATSDDHFPCLPTSSTYRFKNEINQTWTRTIRDINIREPASIIVRSVTPFTKVVQINENEQVVTLSCVGYFESQVHPKVATSAIESSVNEDNDSHQLYQLQFSVGLASALFPLRGRRAGFDKNSFGYHGDGRIYHGSRNCIKIGPSYDIGDIVGCGVMYPPLGKQHGQIFYTKNGVLAAVLDIGIAGVLSLPWFPVVGLAPSIPTEFNFGILKSFAFDVIAFEEQQLIEAFGTTFPISTSSNFKMSDGREMDDTSTDASLGNNSNYGDVVGNFGVSIEGDTYTNTTAHISDDNRGNYSRAKNNNDSSNSINVKINTNGNSMIGHMSIVNSHSDPWRHYEVLADEQETKQRIPRHPKYRNCRWDPSTRSADVLPHGSSGAQMVQSQSVSQNVGYKGSSSGAQMGGATMYEIAVPSSSSSSSSVGVTNTHALGVNTGGGFGGGGGGVGNIRKGFSILAHQSKSWDGEDCIGMNVTHEENTPSDPNFSTAVTPRDARTSSALAANRPGKERGRERGRGRGGDFLLAKRQYAYISRSAKLERLTTIISANNVPNCQNSSSSSVSKRTTPNTANNVSGINNSSTKISHDTVDDRKKVCASRERTLQEKGKRKRKSLFLNPDLRAATLAELLTTSRPIMGGSDASCEDEAEEDSEEEEDDEEELASTCGQDAESQDEWGFKGFRANRPLLPPRIMIRAPTSYSAGRHEHEHELDNDDYTGSMAVEPSSEDEDEDDKQLTDVPFAIAPRPTSSPLAMRPPSLPEGSRARTAKAMTYHTLNNFESSARSYQDQGAPASEAARGGLSLSLSNDIVRLGANHNDNDNSMGKFVALADVAHGSGPDWLRRGSVAGSASSSSSAFGRRVDQDRDSDESVATSLFVEVASVDECGSYVGYGGAGDSEEEDVDDEMGSERGSRNDNVSMTTVANPMGWGGMEAHAHADLESLSVEDKMGSINRKRKGFPSGRERTSDLFNAYHNSGSNSNLRVMWDPDGDGYDGASERGRCETDGFEDFNTDGDVEFEETEERDDRYSNSSGSGYDGSVDADGCASETYATERNTVLRYTLLPPSIAVPRGSHSTMHSHSQDSSVSVQAMGRGQAQSTSMSAMHPQHPLPLPLSVTRQHGSHTAPLSQSQLSMSMSMSTGGNRRPKRRKTHHQPARRDSGSREFTDDPRLHR